MQEPNSREPRAAPASAPASALPRVTFSAPDLDWLMVILLRRWRWMLGAALAAAAGVLLALPFLTKQYEISAALLFKLGREQAPQALSGTPAIAAPFKRTEDITSEAEIITSQALVENLVKAFGTEYFLARKPPQTVWEHIKEAARWVVRSLREAITEVMILIGLEKRLTPFEHVVSILQGSLQAEAVKRADVIEVKLLFADQQAGSDVMNKLIALYLAEHIRAFQTPGATQFLEARVAGLKAELATLEAQRRDFSQRSALWDLDEQRKSLLLQQRELRQALARAAEEASRVQAEIQQAAHTLAATPAERRTSRVEQSNPVAQQLQQRIVEQRAKLERQRLVFGAESRRILDEETELAQLERLLAAQAKSVVQHETFEPSASWSEAERTLAERQTRLAGLQALQQRQRDQDRQLGEELARLDQLGERSRSLGREVALAEQNYQLYARRLEEARISDALDKAEISNVAVIGRPTASISPTRPRAKLLFFGALAAGLLGSFGAFVLADALRPTVHRRDKAAAILGAPVLARLPEVRP